MPIMASFTGPPESDGIQVMATVRREQLLHRWWWCSVNATCRLVRALPGPKWCSERRT